MKIPSSVKIIGERASLDSVTIPNSVVTNIEPVILNGVFAHCDRLQIVHLLSPNDEKIVEEGRIILVG